MSITDGKIAERLDLRPNSIQEFHVRDEAVTTPKIDDLAASIEKVAEPSFVFAGEGEGFSSITLNTTPIEYDSITVDIPAWVGRIYVFAAAGVSTGAGSVSPQGIVVSCRINDVDDGGFQFDAVTGERMTVTHFESVAISSPGSSVQISAYAYTTVGTSTANAAVGTVWAVVLGER